SSRYPRSASFSEIENGIYGDDFSNCTEQFFECREKISSHLFRAIELTRKQRDDFFNLITGEGRGLNAASRLLSQNQAFRSTSSISSRNISKLSHCSSVAASSSLATPSACVVALNRPGSRAYRSRSARTAFSPAICVCNSPIRADSISRARRSLKLI